MTPTAALRRRRRHGPRLGDTYAFLDLTPSVLAGCPAERLALFRICLFLFVLLCVLRLHPFGFLPPLLSLPSPSVSSSHSAALALHSRFSIGFMLSFCDVPLRFALLLLFPRPLGESDFDFRVIGESSTLHSSLLRFVFGFSRVSRRSHVTRERGCSGA